VIRFVIVYFFYKLITTASDGEGDSGERVGCVCVGCGAEREVVERREVDGVGKWRA